MACLAQSFFSCWLFNINLLVLSAFYAFYSFVLFYFYLGAFKLSYKDIETPEMFKVDSSAQFATSASTD
tara:strand:+ start:1818 stop:2024 length:207 start_codon:yes stop_codon:yes gene_type:complete